MEALKQKIIDLCNKSGLPLEAILFVVKDVWRDAEASFRAYQESLKQQEQEKDKEEEK